VIEAAREADLNDDIVGATRHLDFPYLARVTATNALTAASMAAAPAPPAHVEIGSEVTPDTKLSWHPGPGAHPAGYRVYWRDTTGAVWAHSRDAGAADSLTLANVPIDDFAFGVASVSADGFESPVVYPGAAGAFWKTAGPSP
jgi:hypothetical protein